MRVQSSWNARIEWVARMTVAGKSVRPRVRQALARVLLAPTAGPYTPSMARALIIESDAALAKSLSNLLAAKGTQTQVTADGTEGVSLARSFKPDVIILCVELSRVSGYSICNKLKKDPELGQIPLVLTSSQATEETFEQHKKLKTRAEAYLKKPYSDTEIMALAAPYLGGGASADVDVDEVSVDIDDAAMGGGDLDLDLALETSRGAPSRTSARPAAASNAPRASTMGSSAAADAHLEQLRAENRQLRQKMQKLEESIEHKELEFNDRLLQESSRGREGLEARKKTQQLERDAAKFKELAERLRAELEESQRELDEARMSSKSGDSEKQVLATKIGQLVDKVKSLVAERDALQQRVQELEDSQASGRDESENAAKIREKARKAVDIAVQLIDETGLLQ